MILAQPLRMKPSLMNTWKQRAKALKSDILALYLACKDPRMPWHARLMAAAVVGYAFSPIDLIPDPIPVLGYLDDLILIPLGIYLVIRWTPPDLLADCRQKARSLEGQKMPKNWLAGVIIVALWVAAFAIAVYFLYPFIVRFLR